MTREEILAKAKVDYPIGTKVYAAHTRHNRAGSIFTVDSYFFSEGHHNNVQGSSYKTDEGYSPCLYFETDDKWATIISRPTHVIINNYELY